MSDRRGQKRGTPPKAQMEGMGPITSHAHPKDLDFPFSENNISNISGQPVRSWQAFRQTSSVGQVTALRNFRCLSFDVEWRLSGQTRHSLSVAGWERVHPYHRPQFTKLFAVQLRKRTFAGPEVNSGVGTTATRTLQTFDLVEYFG